MSLVLSELNFPSFFDGSWVGEKFGQNIEFKDGMCSFKVTKNCPLSRKMNVITLTYKDQEYFLICATQNSLSWSDGDIWVRKSEVERRLGDMCLKDFSGSWTVLGSEFVFDVSDDGVVRFQNGEADNFLLRKDQNFVIEGRQKNYELLVTSYDGKRLCWNDLGVWDRNIEFIEGPEISLPVEYQHFHNHQRFYHRDVIDSVKSSMGVRLLKDRLIEEVKKNFKIELGRSEVHIVNEGRCISDEDLPLVTVGLKTGMKLTIITMDDKTSTLDEVDIVCSKDKKKKEELLDGMWKGALVKSQSEPRAGDTPKENKSQVKKRASQKFRLGSAGPTEPKTFTLEEVKVSDPESEKDVEEDEEDEEDSSDYTDCSSSDEKQLQAPARSGANLLRQKTKTPWSQTQIEKMSSEMKEHFQALQKNEKLIKGYDLETLDLDAFSGMWVGKRAKQNITIKGSKGEIDFLDTKGCPFYRDDQSKNITVDYNKAKFEVVKVPLSLNEILWSDGDVWIRRPDENAQSDPKNVEISELQGRWFHGVAKDQPCEIRGNVVNFRQTKGNPLVKNDEGIHILNEDVRIDVVQVSSDKKRIFWSDKDVWYRDENIDVNYKSDAEFFGDYGSIRRVNTEENDERRASKWRLRALSSATPRGVLTHSRFAVFRRT